ncbi:ABC transporter [Virgisporangium aliadipatigenens]|uniref:ABC transporter n=1 Tax=Virgisporangium aliadipatigenens TaxID=741659 RepID=A0A8J4DPL7_9ACTN|nr:ABC transporter permease [Virgisporangium aliadipatigenens]GIJ45056.1 ABC transporter [Virgisporangium aliadipatigenens]
MTDLAKPASEAPPEPHGTDAPRKGSFWTDDATEPVRRNLGLVGVLLAIWVVGAITVPRIFLSGEGLWNNELIVLQQSAAIGVIAVGMTFVIIGGGIDLSVGALVALTSVWCTTQATQAFGPAGMVFTAILVGAIAGLVNGFLIAYGRVVAFIATLAMLVAARGLAQLISGKRTQRVNIENVGITDIAENRILGIPILVWMLLVVAAVGWVLLNRTTFGRRTFAVGGNPEAARLAGINLRRHTVALYVLSGICCGIGAVMVVAQATAGAPDHGDLYELDAIAAAIIGGTALAGGRGSIVGAILGVLVFKGITNLFIVNNLEQEYQLIVKGAIIVGAVLLQQFRIGSLPQLRKSAT